MVEWSQLQEMSACKSSASCACKCTALLLCFLLTNSDGVLAIYPESVSETVAGTYYSAVKTDEGVAMYGTVVLPPGMSYYVNTTFLAGEFPYQCGESLRRCNVTIVSENFGTREAAVIPLVEGVGLTLFNISSTSTTILDQHVLTLADFEPTINCNFTSFTTTVDPIHTDDTGYSIYGFCYNFLPMSSSDEVEMWIFTVVVNFDRLNNSRLQLLYPNRSPYTLSSTGLSNPFLFGSDVCSTPALNVVWYDDAYLYRWRADTGSFTSFDSGQPVCYGNNVSQVKLFLESQLLAYCANDTVVEVDVCRAGGEIVPSLARPTIYYCSSKDNSTYVKVIGDNLILFSRKYSSISVPHQLNTSYRYVGDCIEIANQIYFVVSSTNDTIIFINILESEVSVLSKDSSVYHKLVWDRFILYSNSTSSVVLDLSCLSPVTPIHVHNEPFALSAFQAYENFSCLTVQPLPPSNALAIILGSTLGGIAVLTIVGIPLVLLLILLCYRYCRNRETPSPTAEEGYNEADATLVSGSSPDTKPKKNDADTPSATPGVSTGATPSIKDSMPKLDAAQRPHQPENSDKDKAVLAAGGVYRDLSQPGDNGESEEPVMLNDGSGPLSPLADEEHNIRGVNTVGVEETRQK